MVLYSFKWPALKGFLIVRFVVYVDTILKVNTLNIHGGVFRAICGRGLGIQRSDCYLCHALPEF